MPAPKTLRTCANGHQYYKTTDCPVCPICENKRKDEDSPFADLGAPARRALENAGITSVEQLAQHPKKDILKLHGMGRSSMPKLQSLLQEQGLSFKSG